MNATFQPYRESLDAARTLLSQDEGITITRSGGPVNGLSAGYIVGGRVPTLVLNVRDALGDRTLDILTVARWLDSLETSITNVGSWVNDGKVYIDAVDHIANHEEAYKTGFSRGEIAIWDCAAQTEIIL